MRGAVEKGPIFLRDKAFKAQQSQRVRAQVVRAAAEESPRGVRRCLRTESATWAFRQGGGNNLVAHSQSGLHGSPVDVPVRTQIWPCGPSSAASLPGSAPPPLNSKLPPLKPALILDALLSPQNKSKRRINVVKLHPRGFEAIILLDSTLRRAHKPSMARLSVCCPSLSESGLRVSLGMEQSVTSLFEAQFTKCHLMSGSLGSSFPVPFLWLSQGNGWKGRRWPH